MKLKFVILTVLFFFTFKVFPQQNHVYKPLLKAADSIAASGFSGVIMVKLPGQDPEFWASGLKNRERGTPISRNDLFNIFSLGKSLTAATAVKLSEEGKLDLNKTIADYLPDSDIPNAEKITVKHLLGHSSGLGNYMNSPLYEFDAAKPLPLDSIISVIEKQELILETPGEGFSYSNSGYIVLGAIIEAVTGKPYKMVLEEKILNPAGIKEAFFSYDHPLQMQYYEDNSVINNAFPATSSDGGLIMNARALGKFIELLSSDYFSEASKKQLFEVITALPDRGDRSNAGIAASFLTYTYGNGCRVIGNNGGFHGTNSAFRIVNRPNGEKITLVLLTNEVGKVGSAVNALEKIAAY